MNIKQLNEKLFNSILGLSLTKLKQMVKDGADPKIKNISNLNLLHRLSQYSGNVNIKKIKFLIKNGADVNLQDCEGWTPLHDSMNLIGEKDYFFDISVIFLESGANPYIKNNDGKTPIDLCRDKNILNTIRKIKLDEIYGRKYKRKTI